MIYYNHFKNRVLAGHIPNKVSQWSSTIWECLFAQEMEEGESTRCFISLNQISDDFSLIRKGWLHQPFLQKREGHCISYFSVAVQKQPKQWKIGAYGSREPDPIMTEKACHVSQEASWLHFNPHIGSREKGQEVHQSYKPSKSAPSDFSSSKALPPKGSITAQMGGGVFLNQSTTFCL